MVYFWWVFFLQIHNSSGCALASWLWICPCFLPEYDRTVML